MWWLGPWMGLTGGVQWDGNKWGELMQTLGLRAQSLGWLLGLEMRKHVRHSGLIEDAPLPAWSIHYL